MQWYYYSIHFLAYIIKKLGIFELKFKIIAFTILAHIDTEKQENLKLTFTDRSTKFLNIIADDHL